MTQDQAKEIRNTVKKVLDNETLTNNMFSFYERWQDEKEYEDWTEYKGAIERSVKEGHPDMTFMKATNRPFGFQAKIDGEIIKFSVRRSKKHITFIAKG